MSINLQKGQRISLKKDNDEALTHIEIGVNWGMIQKKGFLGSKNVAVDLDASIGMFDEHNQVADIVYFGQLKSKCGSIKHSGDDRQGDAGGDDGEDNETIKIELTQVPSSIKTLAIVLDSFRGQDFRDIPHAGVRIHGGQGNAKQEFARFDISNSPDFAGKVSMILGSVYRHNGEWKFRPIGETTHENKLQKTLEVFQSQFLS